MKIGKFYDDVSNSILQIYNCDEKNLNIKNVKIDKNNAAIFIKDTFYGHNGRTMFVKGIGWKSINAFIENDRMFVSIVVNFPHNKQSKKAV